jgi:hypothetical protein
MPGLTIEKLIEAKRLFEQYAEDEPFVRIGPDAFRTLVILGYGDGGATWSETYNTLFNDGWRGPVDRNGFPTQFRGP